MLKIIMNLAFIGATLLSAEIKDYINKPQKQEVQEVVIPVDTRKEALEKFLTNYNSPLVSSSDQFLKVADNNDLDWRLLPAISGVESTFGRFQIETSYNPFGWNNGYEIFSSWDEGIEIVGDSLGELKNLYNIDTPEELGPTYCPPNYQKWIAGVNSFMSELDQLENSL